MKVYHNIADFNHKSNSAVTIGMFDGVHLGHKSILQQLNRTAIAKGFQSVVLTFDPHPRQILFPEQKDLFLLSTPDEKSELIAQCGIEHLIYHPFSAEFANQSAESYVKNVLVDGLGARLLIIGYDHRFGKNREGTVELLNQLAEKFKFTVIETPALEVDTINISSSKIRKSITAGDLVTANQYLGYCYSFSGLVTEGKKLGRSIGYPTANITQIDSQKLIPANGVYAVYVKWDSKRFPAMLNIGTNPTTDQDALQKIEVHIHHFEGDIYGRKIEIEMHRRMRDEKKFNSIDELKQQLLLDKMESLRILNS